MKPAFAPAAYLLISHGSRDPRSQEAMTQLANLVRQHLEESLKQPAATAPSNTAPSNTVPSNGIENLAEATAAAVDKGALEEDYSMDSGSSRMDSGSSRMDSGSSRMDSGSSSYGQGSYPPAHQPVQAYSEARADLHSLDRSYSHRGQVSVLARPLPATAPLLPLSQVAFNQTTQLDRQVIVGTACLELAPLPLNEQIYQFGCRLKSAGIRKLKLLPVFLMSGVHVMEDIPAEVATAAERLGDAVELTLCPHLGSHDKIPDVLARRLATMPSEGSLLIAHGSRRPRGNRAIKALAKRLNTAVAYWATPPDLETQAIELMQKGCQRLTILPYFLFAGGITDAIIHRTEELAERFPRVNFRILPTLGATQEIAQLAVELILA